MTHRCQVYESYQNHNCYAPPVSVLNPYLSLSASILAMRLLVSALHKQLAPLSLLTYTYREVEVCLGVHVDGECLVPHRRRAAICVTGRRTQA